MQPEGQVRGTQLGAPAGLVEDGHAEPPLPPRQIERAEPFEEAPVRRRALHEEVLAVVDLVAGLVVAEGIGGAPGPGAAFEQFDLVAAVGELQPSRQAGEPRADDVPTLTAAPGSARSRGPEQGGAGPEARDRRQLLEPAQADPVGEHVRSRVSRCASAARSRRPATRSRTSAERGSSSGSSPRPRRK